MPAHCAFVRRLAPALPRLLAGVICLSLCGRVFGQETVAGTQPLSMTGDLSVKMIEGIDRFLDRETANAFANRPAYWHYDFSSRTAFDQSVRTNREQLRKVVGAVDSRLPVEVLELDGDTRKPAQIAEFSGCSVYRVRWPVLEGVQGEGIWLKPKGRRRACVLLLPDADQPPEVLADLEASGGGASAAGPEPIGRLLADAGCEVLIPALISRSDEFSGSAKINRFTNQPHREWIYRQAFQMGRHIIGYELEKIFAALDFFGTNHTGEVKIGIAGYGEGGLLALYAAALDTRIDAALVSGYFGPRESLWQEPIYRNLFGLLNEFGDAEIATLISPRKLIVERSACPAIPGPPPSRNGRAGAARGKIETPGHKEVLAEAERARKLLAGGGMDWDMLRVFSQPDNTLPPFSEATTEAFIKELHLEFPAKSPGPPNHVGGPANKRDAREREERQVAQLTAHTQELVRDSARARDAFFWKQLDTNSVETLQKSSARLKNYFWTEVIGRFTNHLLAPNPRTRKILEKEKWTAYEVVLDVYPDVFAWGYLLVPKDLKSGEHRPAVVCQHGLDGVPADVIAEADHPEGYHYYKAFGARLAEQGFVVFAPHNPYRGGDRFRILQRKANPIGKSLFSFITVQHEQILNWLASQAFVDPKRIAFYGLSYGGKTAMRVPPLLDHYALAICSGDFNEWNRKVTSIDYSASYMFTAEWEIDEWNLGNTFDYAELAALIAPRPFMVERGHDDGVGPDEWVAAEYATVRRFYTKIGIPQRTSIEFFNGPHTINGKGTFDFLHQYLNWPMPRN